MIIYNTGWKAPTITGSPNVYNQWTNPTNAYVEDGLFASCNGIGLYQSYSGFGFGIPSTAVIVGIEVMVKAKVHSAPGADNIAVYVYSTSALQDGREQRSVVSVGLTTPLSWLEYGGSNDLWNANDPSFTPTWLASDFTDAKFYIILAANTVDVDAVKVQVFYYIPGDSTPAGNFLVQTTDQRPGDTNTQHSNVILKNTIAMTMAAQATGFGATATIALPLNANIALLKAEAMAYNWNTGAGNYDYPIPFSETNLSGAVARSARMRFITSAQPNSYSLEIMLYDASVSQNNLQVYYRVLSVAP